ncbi:MAG: exodeoxyribonuclease VII large subunit [Planctomycetota bacterium]
MSLFDDVPRRPRSGRRTPGASQRARRPAPADGPREGPGDGPGDGPGEGPEEGPGGRAPGEGDAVETVGQLTARIDAALKRFGRVAVEGEISRPKTVASGHVFFTLKDDRAALDAKIWRSQVPRALAGGLRLEDGARVVCHGTLDVYPPYGKHSLIVDRVETRGIGALLAELERLKARLAEEGLFDRRRPLPRFPRRVGVVTSRDADAWRDFLRTRSLRWRGYPVRLAHSRVQGRGASLEVARAIEALDASGVDVVVVCRGGGSIEDLWCFNEEPVARAIWACSVPVVTGVGHETDTTLVDLVADHRAHTPTDAAQTVLPDREALSQAVERQEASLTDAMDRALRRREERFERAAAARTLRRPEVLVEDRGRRAAEAARRATSAVNAGLAAAATRVERLAARVERQSPIARLERAEASLAAARVRLLQSMEARLGAAERRLEPAARALNAVSPLAVLERGYSITRREGGDVVVDPAQLSAGDRLTTILHGGEVDSVVAGDSAP